MIGDGQGFDIRTRPRPVLAVAARAGDNHGPRSSHRDPRPVSDPHATPEDGGSPALVLAYSNLGHVFTHLFTILYATAVLHLPGVFGLPYGELLSLASVGLVLYGVAALPAGWLGDRWSQVGMMVVFFVGTGAGSIVTGLASGTAGLFAGLTLIGLFASIYHPVGIAWLVASVRRQGMTLGFNGVFGSMGSAVGPVFVGAMIDWVSWRAAFIVPGVLAIGTGALLAYAWWRGLVRDARADRVPAPPAGRGAMARVFVILTFTMTCGGFIYSGLTNTMPKLFETGLGPELAGSYTQIGLYVGAITGAASLSSLLGGWLADRYSPRQVYLAFWLLSVLPVYLMTTTRDGALLGATMLAMFFHTAYGASENLLVARYTPFRWRALAYGAKFVLALGVGGLAVHLAGKLFDHAGSFDLMYLSFAGFGVLAFASALLLPRPAPRLLPAGASA
jgi:MFS family permease